MIFPTTGSGRPYVRIDGRSGSFALSVPDGDPEIVEMKNRLLDLDIAGAEQGWLRLSTDGADWVALGERDGWAGTPRPSADHAPGFCIDLMCADWPEPQVRQLRGSSRAITGFIARIAEAAEAAGAVPDGKAVRVRLTGARVVKIGKGTSAEIGFEIAPRDNWPLVAAFDAHRGDDAAADGASGAFGDIKDSPLDGPDKAAADAWA